MPLAYHPRAGQILMCDFDGFRVPEMVKVRPVMVISPRLPHRNDIVTIVPISLTAPIHKLPFNVRLSKNYHPQESDELPCWAKCDMVMNLGTWRLDGLRLVGDSGKTRKRPAMTSRQCVTVSCGAWAWEA